MTRRVIRILLLALAGIVLLATPVLAYLYRAPVAITENASTSYDMLSVNQTANIQWMVDNGFISSSGLDTRVEILSDEVLK